MKNQRHVLFREVQRPRQIWFWALILLLAAFMWYGFIQQVILGVPFGDNPAPDVMVIIFWLVFGNIFPVLMLGMLKLITEVRDDGLYIRFIPLHFHYKLFLFKDIRNYQSITYSPFKRLLSRRIFIRMER